VKVELGEFEQETVRRFARLRTEHARQSGLDDYKIGSQSAEITDLEGMGGEWAFCKLFNLYPDMTIGHRPDYDVIFADGTTIDVKATRYETGSLQVPARKLKKRVDFYVLMVGTFPRYRYAGKMAAAQIFTPERLKQQEFGSVYKAEQNELDL
jgi:Family of unknown function (DUF5843)